MCNCARAWIDEYCPPTMVMTICVMPNTCSACWMPLRAALEQETATDPRSVVALAWCSAIWRRSPTTFPQSFQARTSGRHSGGEHRAGKRHRHPDRRHGPAACKGDRGAGGAGCICERPYAGTVAHPCRCETHLAGMLACGKPTIATLPHDHLTQFDATALRAVSVEPSGGSPTNLESRRISDGCFL